MKKQKGKKKSKLKPGKGIVKKKSFLDNQKKHKQNLKRAAKDPSLKEDDTRVRFENFSSQVSGIEGSIVYQLASRTGNIQVDADSTASVLSETLSYWREMNLSAHFQEVDKKLAKFTSLTQVIFSQSDIVSILCEALSQGTEFSLQPVLELVSALATDLQQEFCPNLSTVLNILMTGPFKIRDANVIKWSLKCLGHLLKILWKPISQQLIDTYMICEQLFSLKRPDYIRYLSAETLAFLLRKTPDKETFLRDILTFDNTVTDSVAVAKMLFEGIKTVNEQFNNHCSKLWPLYVDQLLPSKVDILEKVCEFCSEHSTKEHIEPLIKVLLKRLVSPDYSCSNVITCLNIFINFKAGKLINNVAVILEALDQADVESKCPDDFLTVSESLINGDKIVKTQEQTNKLIERVLNSDHVNLDQKLEFVRKFFDSDNFDSYLLKPYLTLLQSHVQESFHKVVRHLSSFLLTRCPLPVTGDQLQHWSPPTIDLMIVPSLRSIPKQDKMSSIILDRLSSAMVDPDQLTQCLVCLASLRPVSRPVLLDKTVTIANHILTTSESYSVLPVIIVLLSTISDKTVAEHISLEQVIRIYSDNPSNKDCVKSLNFLLSSSKDSIKVGAEQTRALLQSLQCNLSSWDPETRLLCLQSMLQLLPMLGPGVRRVQLDSQMSLLDVFRCLLSVETAADSLGTYKDKINTLERLEWGRVAKLFSDHNYLATAPLHYMLGLLYTNFTLLWSPLISLVSSYGHGLPRDVFWPIMSGRLVSADNDIRTVITNIRDNVEQDSLRVDHISYRNHLWEILTKITAIAEAKNRELVALFLDNFMKMEYVEIRRLAETDTVESQHKSVVQSTVKSMLSHLNVFVKFLDLKSLHRSSELRDLVNNLLCHKLASVQKVALDILVAYKLKFLLPYKDNLGRLLEEKDFKAELLSFPLAGEDCQIKEEHRAELMPVVMRILYGRMRSVKAGGRKKGSKGNVSARRGLVLHHLMVLSEPEMTIFFDLVFKDLFTGCSFTPGDDIVQHVLDGKDGPEKSPQQLQACIEMMQMIMAKLGKLLDTNLSYLASVILWMGHIVNNLNYNDKVRGVRNSLYSLLSNFLNKYSSYTWTEQQTDALMSVYVWSLLPKFETDFIHSSSGLLQILLSWSKNVKYHEMFKRKLDGLRILEKICMVLNNPVTNSKVVMAILTILHNLVTVEDEDNMETDAKIGVEIVLAEMDIILEYFQGWIKKSNENVKNIQKAGVKLDIVLALAPHVSSPDTSLMLFKQLMILSNNLKKPESVLKVLTITKLLVEKISVAELSNLAVDLVPMFGRINTRNERLELARVLENCASTDPTLCFSSEICTELNSYDRKRLDEPDFERRMNIFRKVRDFVKEDKTMSNLEISSVLYNCCFFLKHETESSLKANALEALNFLGKIMLKMSKCNPDVGKVIIDKICFDFIKAGIKNKDDSIRCDFLSFLQSLVVNCSEAEGSHRLKDLSKLVDSDPDLNILENLRHVQNHRRGRAMTKIAASLEADTSFLKTKNLTQLFLPLAGSYLLNDKFAKNSDLLDQAISLVRSIARCLPWSQYEHSVKYYLEMFTKDTLHQKQLVKIMSAVLDAFHFEVGDAYENSKKPSEETSEGKTKEELQKARIFWTVNNVLLPKLHGTLSGKTKGPVSVSDEDKLILRVPLAIPIVKMLKIISGKLLFRQVPGIINKIVSFLKSKAIEIREAARATLCSVMELLGPKYISFVIKEMSANLTRGYLQHIHTFTTHSLLTRLAKQSMLVPGDLDTVVGLLTDLALTEMFSSLAEEKEVRKITGKLMEARGSKCYDTLQIVARFVSNDQLFNLVKPFADKAAELRTFKNLQKIKEMFRNIVLGLLDNKDLDVVASLIFIYGIINDKLDIGSRPSKPSSRDSKENISIFIVPRAPKRSGAEAKNSQSSSQHIVHEFGLNLLFFLLKRGSLDSGSELHCERLEPFINILISCLSSSHVSLITTAVRCLLWLVKFPLKVLDKVKIAEITNKVFDLLNKFGGGTDGKGENHDLVIIASKLLVILIRDVELTILDQDHLKTVLTYVVNDVMDPFKATTAFGLLTAILNRRLETESTELHDVMVKMVELSIQSLSVQTRQAARSTIISYVKNYSLKKKLGRILDLYCAQLSYEHEFGRLSAAETLKFLINVIGRDRADQHASFLLVSMAPVLVNDDSSAVKKALASSLSSLVKTVSKDVCDKLLQSTLTWYRSVDNQSHTLLACHLLTIFVDTLATEETLTSRLETILGRLPDCMASGDDSLTVQSLTLLTKMLHRSVVSPSDTCLTPAWARVHTCLLHSHTWTRLLSAQLLGVYLSHVTPDTISQCCRQQRDNGNTWLGSVATLKSLVLDSIEQLSLVTDTDNDLGTQVVKNIVAMAKVTLTKDWDSVLDISEDKITFAWVLRKCLKVANQELISTPNTVTRRVLVFNLVAAACLGAESEQVVTVLRVVLPPLHRAVSGPVESLRQHCQEVLDLIKTRVEEDVFSEVYMEIQMSLAKQKGERSQTKKQNLIKNPEAAAKRKIRLNESKKKAKKAKYNK